MRFRNAQYAVVPTPAAPERSILFRPVIPVRFIGPKDSRHFYALLETGADESYITEGMASKLGVEPISVGASTIHSASGAMSVVYGRITVEVAAEGETFSFPVTVGIVSEDWSEAILGHIGFLEQFDATFSYAEKVVTLTRQLGRK